MDLFYFPFLQLSLNRKTQPSMLIKIARYRYGLVLLFGIMLKEASNVKTKRASHNTSNTISIILFLTEATDLLSHRFHHNSTSQNHKKLMQMCDFYRYALWLENSYFFILFSFSSCLFDLFPPKVSPLIEKYHRHSSLVPHNTI